MDFPADISLADLLGGDESTAQQRAQALAAALRQQQAQAQERQLLGGLGSVFGASRAGVGKAVADMGAHDYAQAGEQLEAIPKAMEGRLQRALEKQRADQQAARDAQQAKYQGEEMALKRQEVNQHRYSTVAPGGQLYDTRTGELGAVGDVPKPPPGSKAGGGAASASAMDKALRAFREDVDPSSGRGQGLFAKDQAIVTNADKVLALLDDGKGGRNYNLTVRQVPELVQAVASTLSGGNATAMAQLEHLMPKSWGSSTAERLEYLSGHPQDAKLGEFVKQYAETMDREKHLAQKRVKDVQLRRGALHQGAFSQYPDAMKAAARQFFPEMSDEDLAAYFQGTYAPKAAGGGDRDAKMRRLKEIEAQLAAHEPAGAPK